MQVAASPRAQRTGPSVRSSTLTPAGTSKWKRRRSSVAGSGSARLAERVERARVLQVLVAVLIRQVIDQGLLFLVVLGAQIASHAVGDPDLLAAAAIARADHVDHGRGRHRLKDRGHGVALGPAT